MHTKSGLRLAFLLAVIVGLLAAPSGAAAGPNRPGGWVKYAGNPVLNAGAPGAWDAQERMDPAVLLDGTTYRMWYTGWTSGQPTAIGYAWSMDGLNWTPNAGPVLSGTSGWDQSSVRSASVILDGGTFKMWYTGRGATGGSRIGYATSTNGTGWTKYGTGPVLDVGAAGSWENNSVVEPSVIKVGSTYQMWYRGRDGSFRGGIGYAYSPDGISWTKYAGNPVIADAAPGNWDYAAYGPSVIFDGSLYHMWYSGTNFASTASEIGYATSSDGIHWSKQGRVLQQGADGAFDRFSADYGAVLLDGNTFKMWYSGLDGLEADSAVRIGYASAPLFQVTATAYLPLTLKNWKVCSPIWFDDFSDYHSGWPIYGEAGYEYGYVGGEYRILVNQADAFYWVTPGIEMTDGTIATDVRFTRSGNPLDNGGIMFGKSLDDYDNFYRFTLQANGICCIQRHAQGSAWTDLSCGPAPGFAAYPASNWLKVVRNGSAITGYVNGQLAATVNDSTYTGSLRVGLSAGAAVAGAGLRFDNYGIYSVPCGN